MTSPTSVRQVDPSEFDWQSSAGVAEAVRRTVADATATDGRAPLNEAALLSLRHNGISGSTLWVAESADPPSDDGSGVAAIDGFALADAPSDSSGPVEVNLVVTPKARRRGVGRALGSAVLQAFPDADLSAWSHTDHPGAAALAQDLGFDRVRDLWVMRRSLVEPLPEVAVPDGCVVRPFEPGRDEDAFLEVNAAAFAHHPEQGAMTRGDLDQRMAEEWFDPAGFFLAVSTGSTVSTSSTTGGSTVSTSSTTAGSTAGGLLGFHWTKVHQDDPSYGEVYVVGVSPNAQGMGLGKVLTLTGLHHLRSLGLGEVILYVESDNDAAVAVYRGLGFTHADDDTDVMYARHPVTDLSGA